MPRQRIAAGRTALGRYRPARRRLSMHLLLRHGSILVSKVRSLHIFQGDSRCPLSQGSAGFIEKDYRAGQSNNSATSDGRDRNGE
jgi:hypothetical protein